jgi:hypothetical protein
MPHGSHGPAKTDKFAQISLAQHLLSPGVAKKRVIALPFEYVEHQQKQGKTLFSSTIAKAVWRNYVTYSECM